MRASQFAAAAVLFVAMPLAGGCASTGEGGGDAPGDVLTRELLAPYDNLTAFDAMVRLKPIWVRSSRLSRIRIYVDGILEGGRSTLRNIQTRNVEEIEFLDPREATMEFGTDHGGGALLVSTRRGG